MKNTNCFLLSLACGLGMVACVGGKKGAPPQGASLPPQTPNGKFDPGPAGTPADHEKAQREAAAKAMERGVKPGEFQLKLMADPSVGQIQTINIDVISATGAEAARLEKMGPATYRDSRQPGSNTLRHVFTKDETSVTVQVPSIPAADSILLWAELAAPTAGADSRMLVIPLTLDKSDPAKGPVAAPITVKLTANGWVRES